MMEEKMDRLLDLPVGLQVLNAGCGVGHVALYIANHGPRVTAIDVMDNHLAKAKKNVTRSGDISSLVAVEKMDYHHFETLLSEGYDGAYTMETLVHATDPLTVLKGFYRTFKPGGHLAMDDYDHFYESNEVVGKELAKLMKEVSEYGSMPAWQRAHRGCYKLLLKEAGFVDLEEHDYSENIRPMLRLIWLLAAIPYYIIVFFYLEATVARGAIMRKSIGDMWPSARGNRRSDRSREAGMVCRSPNKSRTLEESNYLAMWRADYWRNQDK